MKILHYLTFLGLFLAASATQAQVSPDVEYDKLMIQAENLLKEGSYQRAEQVFGQISDLQNFDPQPEFHYKYGLTLYRNDHFDMAQKELEEYIRKTGRSDPRYKQILQLLVSIDEAIGDMVLVQGGSFQMGSQNGGADELPVHEVILDDFYIGKYEVTVGQYRKFCEKTGYEMPPPPTWGWVNDHPMVKVTWADAVAYCEWAGGTLPTEAQWEYAARGGQMSKGYSYSGSNDPDLVAWYESNSDGQTHPVGSKQPNELGIYDMSGNVWEWCLDWYSPSYYEKFKDTSARNPEGPDAGRYKVLRGSAWFFSSLYKPVTYRYRLNPDYSNHMYGFRIVKQAN
jgi:hypothetical protein